MKQINNHCDTGLKGQLDVVKDDLALRFALSKRVHLLRSSKGLRFQLALANTRPAKTT